jgi:serine/threonine protein kinase
VAERDPTDRPLLAALPLPLAQAWRRTLYAESPAAAHERALYALEAVLKYAASVAAAAWVSQGSASDAARGACEALVRPSLGHWAAILRACAAALPPQDPARRWLDGLVAAPMPEGVPGLPGRQVGAILDGLPAYRNSVSAHGAGLSSTAVTERAPTLLKVARAVLAAAVGERAPLLCGRVGNHVVRLMGPTAVVGEGDAGAGESLVLQWEGRRVPLSPLWIFDPEEDDVLVLNKGAGLAKVEYLSYGAPRGGSGLLVLKGGPAEALRRFLETVTGQTRLGAADVAVLIEEAEARELASRATGARFGPYHVVRKVAAGGQGVLYEAVQEDPPRRVALKTLSTEAAMVEESHRRLHEEAAALARVEHPNVVPVYATGETDGVPWIAMKFIEGKSLAEVLSALRGHTGPISLAEWNAAASSATDRPEAEKRKPHAERVAELGRDAARALAACHAQGLIHRDVKPGNVMLDHHGRVVLTDFGLARPADARSQTFTRKLVGTLQYLAPESLLPAGRKGPDARVDVYGLGATLYEALSLQAPFANYAQDEGALLHAVQAKDPAPLRKVAPWVPRELQTIVLKAMEKDRDRRYASAAALADDLDRYLNGEPIKARPAGPITRARKWARRHPGKAAGLVALAFAVLGLFIALALDTRRRAERARSLARIRQENAADVATLDASLKAGHFDEAANVAARIRDRLQDVDEPAARQERDHLAAQQERLARVADFYRWEDRVWFLAGAEKHEAADDLGTAALDRVHVFGQDDWWDRLPADDLTDPQVARLRQEVYRVLILCSTLKLKPAFLKFSNRAEAARAAGAARQVLKRAQDWERFQGAPPSRTGQLLGKICVFFSGEGRGRTPGAATQALIQPTNNAVDCFFLGFVHFFLGRFRQDPVYPLVALVMQPTLGSDIDFQDAPGTAERLLRASCALDPSQYWPHFLLGWALVSRGDFRGAELAFDHCVFLQPDNPLGHSWRALAVVQQAPEAPDARSREQVGKELRRRALEDSGHAMALAVQPEHADPGAWWARADLLAKLAEVDDALAAYARALEVDVNVREKFSRRDGLNLARDFANAQIKQCANRSDADSRARLAWAHVVLGLVHFRSWDPASTRAADRGHGDQVEGEATEALKVPDGHRRAAAARAYALALRGSVRVVRGKELTQALDDFEAVLRQAPDNFLAAFGRARAREQRGEHEQALAAYEYLLTRPRADGPPVAVTEDQSVEAHKGRYRMFVRLGRSEQARQALNDLNALDPRAARALQEQLPVP